MKKNKKTKASFQFEWNFLNPEKKDRIWHDDSSQLHQVFLNEVGEETGFFQKKTVLDVGCGHGIMTSQIAGVSERAIGVELSKAVEDAYRRNQQENAWYIQGDLQFLPFEDSTFDVLYSSGVIHHTNNTELSFSIIEKALKPGGKLCLWLYHPRKDLLHNLLLSLRPLTTRMPLRLSFLFLLLFVFPSSYLVKRIRRKRAPNFREEMIDLLDGFTPEFRHETPHDMAKAWLARNYFSDIQITTVNPFGFSIAGEKNGRSHNR